MKIRMLIAAVTALLALAAPGAGDVPPSKAMDLTWTTTDVNGFPENPDWYRQSGTAHGKGSGVTDIDAGNACDWFHNRRGHLYVESCTNQGPTVDEPRPFHGVVPSVMSYVCTNSVDPRERLDRYSVHGHVNWHVATYTGAVSFVDYQFPTIGLQHLVPGDGDLDLVLTRDDHRGYLYASAFQEPAGIVLEANRHELGPLETPWWKRFRNSFENDVRSTDARVMLADAPATVIGLLGIDTKHGYHTELHPMYVMVAKVAMNGRAEHFVFFARNWGNEGGCSIEPHPLDRVLLSVRVASPAIPAPVIGNTVISPATSASPLRQRPDGAAVVVSFDLPPSSAKAVIVGEFDLCNVSCAGVATAPGPNASAAHAERRTARGGRPPGDADERGAEEASLTPLLALLTPDQRRRFVARLTRVVSANADNVTKDLALYNALTYATGGRAQTARLLRRYDVIAQQRTVRLRGDGRSR